MTELIENTQQRKFCELLILHDRVDCNGGVIEAGYSESQQDRLPVTTK